MQQISKHAHPRRRSGTRTETFFDLAIPDHAYLFGLLQTDGSHSADGRNRGRISLELAVRDEAILHRLVDLCPWYSSVRLRRRSTNFETEHESATWRLYSWDARTELTDLGLPPGPKAARIAPPVKDVSARDYVRGLIDGDGSVGFTERGYPFVGFTTASPSMARYIESYVNSVTGVHRSTNPNARDQVFNIMYATDAGVTLSRHLYQEGDLALTRKAERAAQTASWRRPPGMRAAHRRKPWSPEEDEVVMAGRPVVETAEQLGRTAQAVSLRRWRLSQIINVKGE